MLARRISVWTIVAGLLLPAVVGCLLPGVAQAQTMECCAQLTCAQGHQKPVCLSPTAPAGSAQSTPQNQASLEAPAPMSADVWLVATQNSVALGSTGAADAPQHSPPEFYARYLSLLI